MAGYIKAFCPKTGVYSLLTVENRNGRESVVNYSSVTKEVADMVGSYSSPVPEVCADLKPCCFTNGRRAASVAEHKKSCSLRKGDHAYQCLFCSELQLSAGPKLASTYEVFFVMDQSGSMAGCLGNAANAVRGMIRSLEGQGNKYNLIAFGSGKDPYGSDCLARVISVSTRTADISSALDKYERTRLVEGGTDGRVLVQICNEVIEAASRMPVRVIIVTDGQWSFESEALSARDRMVRSGNVEIMAIGIGSVHQSFLSQLGTVREFSKVVSVGDLGKTFEEIAKKLRAGGHN